MIQLDISDLDTYKSNLINKKKTFLVQRKRNEMNIYVEGKRIAKFRGKNSMSGVDKEDSKHILNLFATVKKSINKYIVDNDFQIPVIPKKYDSVFTNRLLFDQLPIGSEFYYVDVKHCYWRIAYLQGYISEYFYLKVLDNPELKIFRNMALSCIIAPKKMEYYTNGKLIWEVEEDTDIYNQIYENIRFTAWNIFGGLAYEKLGQEKTIGYYTDGIMCFKQDLPIVRTVLSRNKLQFRIVKLVKVEDRVYLNTETNEKRKF
jgi:hypothetical protein